MATVIITGANGSLAIPSVKYLLSKYPTYTAVLTVRDENDQNTQKLKEIISHFPSAKTHITTLDLSSLSATREFASEVKTDVATGKLPPLKSIICNAFTWSINGGLVFTSDGYERTIVVNHLAHLALVLSLLDSFTPEGGRITFLASDSHYPGKSGLEKFPPTLPDDLELLVKPEPDKAGEEVGRGLQRYGLSKLAVIMGMYQLNLMLAKDPILSKITAVAMDPGGLPDSRAWMNQGVPTLWNFLMKGFLNPLQPLMKYLIPVNSVNTAAVDLIEISVGEKDASGYYTMMNPGDSSPESKDEEKQKKLWTKSLEWAGITEDQTELKAAFQKEAAAKPPKPDLTPEQLRAKKEREILFLRHKLQKGLLNRDAAPEESQMGIMAKYFSQLERYSDLEASIIKITKINKVLKAILKLEAIPKEAEYNFKSRSSQLLARWNQILENAAAETASKEIPAAAINGIANGDVKE